MSISDNGSPSPPLVIIVEDDDALRESLEHLFTSVGLATASFASASRFQSYALPDRPSCLLLDQRLPGATGLEIQAELTRMGNSIPVIFLSGYADVPTSVRAMKAGASNFLIKPFRRQDLLDAVTEAISHDESRRREDQTVLHLRKLAQSLTPREIDVLRGVRRGLLNKQVAFELRISEITVKMHRASARRKLQSASVADMLRKLELLQL